MPGKDAPTGKRGDKAAFSSLEIPSLYATITYLKKQPYSVRRLL